MRDVVVVGAGAAGLVAARTLHAAGRDVLLLEAGAAPGGVMQTREVDGYRVESGPNTLRVGAPALAALRELGVEAKLLEASPASRRRCLVHDGRLVPIPMDPVAFARTPLLSGRAKWRLLAEPFVRRGDGRHESVAEFARRRLGRGATEALIEPFLLGVYAGDANELGARAVFPSLVESELRSGSIVRGFAAQGLRAALGRSERAPRGLRGTFSSPQGLGGLAHALASGLGDALRLEARVQSVSRDGEGWRVEWAGAPGASVQARRLVVATPAHEAAGLLASVDPELAAGLREIPYAPIAAVALGVDPADVREPIEGFGFLVPAGQDPALLGCLFMSRLFPDRAPAGRELLHCMLGGARHPGVVDEPDERVVERAVSALDRILGMSAQPRVVSVIRWPRAVPQPGRDHARWGQRLRDRAREAGPLHLAGAYLDGVSVSDTLACGARVARSLLAD